MRFCSLEEAYPGVTLGGDVAEESGRKFYEGEAGTPVVASQLGKGFDYTDTKFAIAEKNAFVIPQQEALYAASNVKEGVAIATTSKPGSHIESFSGIGGAGRDGGAGGGRGRNRCGPPGFNHGETGSGVTTGHRCGPYFDHYNGCGTCQQTMKEHFGDYYPGSPENNNLFTIVLIAILIWILLRK